jgi:hypothetical protein
MALVLVVLWVDLPCGVCACPSISLRDGVIANVSRREREALHRVRCIASRWACCRGAI